MLLVTAAVVVGGCSDKPAAGTDPGTTAQSVCVLLRTYVNDTGAIANAAAAVVSGSEDPVGRRDAVLAGFDRLIERTDAHLASVIALDPAVLEQGADLVADLIEGAEQAGTELRDEKAAFEQVPGVEDEYMTGLVGQFFNALEKAMSVVEPVVADYGSTDLIDAFATEPTCRFVVQT